MKTSKRQLRKRLLSHSAFGDPGMGPNIDDYYEQELLSRPKQTGQGWNLANNALGVVSAWLTRGSQPQQSAQDPYMAPTRANNVPLFIGIGIVVLLIVGLVVFRKK